MKLNHRYYFFGFYGLGPYICFFCYGEMSTDDLHVHHVDHNHQNNDAMNLAPAHAFCHGSYHHKGKLKSEHHRAATRAGIAASNRTYVLTDETKSKVSASLKGKPKSDAHRQALSIALKGVPKSEAHKAALRKPKRKHSVDVFKG